MNVRLLWTAVALLGPLLVGCGPSPVVGGTSGVLRAGGEPLGDIQVTVYQPKDAAWQPIGFADTAIDGTFRLLLSGAAGPLELAPGEYRFTLQSVGAPVIVPKELTDVGTTPLRASWNNEQAQLTLSLPKKLRPTRR